MLWLALVLLLVCSGIVSGSETALFGLSRQALHGFGRSKKHLERRAHMVMQHPHQVLMTVLMANTTVNVAIFTISFFVLREIQDGPAAVVVAGALAAPAAVVLFGEMLPKAVALSSATRLAPFAAGLIAMLHLVLGPIQWLLSRLLVEPITRLLAPSSSVMDTVTTEELRLLVEHSAHDRVITSTENEMLQAVVALTDVSVREVMTPRVDIHSIQIDMSPDDVSRAIREFGRRRFPVYGRDLDDIRGVLFARDVHLNPGSPIKSLLARAHFVPEQANLMQLLPYFRAENLHLAVVVDEYGGTAGVVTIEDIVEWVVGELPDSDIPRTTVAAQQIDENTYRLPGDLSAHAWADRFGVGEIDRHVDTVGGLILARLGRLPRKGDSVRIRNLTLTVETMQRRRIEWVLVRRNTDAALPAEDGP